MPSRGTLRFSMAQGAESQEQKYIRRRWERSWGHPISTNEAVSVA